MISQYLTRSQFSEYIEKNIKPALSVVDVNLKNPNKLNEVAAKSLGFDSYHVLGALHRREESIKSALFLERCPFQGGNVTIKAANIIVVFDVVAKVIRFRALKPGQETERVTDKNQFSALFCDDISLDLALSDFQIHSISEALLYPQVEIVLVDDSGLEHALLVKRTHEGVIADLIYGYKGDCGSIDTCAVAFDDADCEDYSVVNQALATVNAQANLATHCYQWLQPIMTEDGLFYAPIGEENEWPLSDFIFNTPEEAVNKIKGHVLGYDETHVEDAVLVKKELTVIGNGQTLCHSNEC